METDSHLNAACAWAIQPRALASIDARSLAQMHAEQAAGAPEAGGVLTATSMRPNAQGGTVAVLPLQGVITPRGSLIMRILGLGGGGLEGFREALDTAVNDSDISAIVLDVNSPGGLVSLVPEVAKEIREAREEKPIIAVANVMAASAAYWLASQASEVVVTESGEVGSIGVLWRHEEFSAMDARIGIKTTLIYAGKHKTEGNPFEPLTEEAKEAFQASVDDFYDMFIADVAAGRGVKEAAVREGFGQGRMVLAEQAVSDGMADRVATLEEVIETAASTGSSAGRSSAQAATPPTSVPEAAPAAEPASEAPAPAAPQVQPAKRELSEEERRRVAAVLLG